MALVTGAGRGIGRVVAETLATKGFHVGLASRTRRELEEAQAAIMRQGGSATVLCGDTSDPAQVEAVVDSLRQGAGPIDLLVNNAGVSGNAVRFLEDDASSWWETIVVNLRSPALMLHTVLPEMCKRQRGRVINLNSLQASAVSERASIAYGVSKAGLCRLTESVAREVKRDGISLFDVSPGLVRTSMTANRPDLEALPTAAWSSPQRAADLVAELATGRYDALTGRFLRVGDDLEALLEDAPNLGSVRTLRMIPLRGEEF